MVCLFLIGSDRESAKVEASSNQFFDEFQGADPSAALGVSGTRLHRPRTESPKI
jgi:hypothetical protein